MGQRGTVQEENATANCRPPKIPTIVGTSAGLELCGDKNKVIFGYVYIVTTITVCDVCNQFAAFRIRTACGFVTAI